MQIGCNTDANQLWIRVAIDSVQVAADYYDSLKMFWIEQQLWNSWEISRRMEYYQDISEHITVIIKPFGEYFFFRLESIPNRLHGENDW